MLTDAILGAVTQAVFEYLLADTGLDDNIRAWLDREPQHIAFQIALTRVYTSFARRYPQWSTSLFDEQFLKKHATPSLAHFLTRTDPPDTAELVSAWADQMGLQGETREKHIAKLLPATSDFFRWLGAELRQRSEFQPLFDSQALDTAIAEATVQTAQATEILSEELTQALAEASKYYVVVKQAQGLVIGDQASVSNVYNQYFSDDFSTLDDYYIRPDAVFQRVQIEEFMGREWLTAKVDAFLNDPNRKSGVFLLTGEAGVGKTTFLSHLVQQRGYLHLFAEQVPAEANLSRALQSLAVQLAARYRIEPYARRDTIPQSLSTYGAFLDRLLRLATKTLAAGEQIVIVCDALDEAGTIPGGNVFGLPAVLPEGVYLILSQRPVPTQLNFKNVLLHTERLEPTSADNQRDVHAYLTDVARRPALAAQLQDRGYSEVEFVQTLADKSAGVWIYLHYVIDEIGRGDRTPLNLAQLPSGLVGYYAEYWGDWRQGRNGRGQGQTKWDELYAPLLTVLAAAQEPISIDQIRAWTYVSAGSHEIQRLLRESWAAFVTERQITERGSVYKFYHASLRDFVYGKVERSNLSPANGYLIDELSSRTGEAHQKIIEYSRQRCDGNWPELVKIEDNYALRHLATHLVEVELVDQLYALVENEAWCKGKHAKFRSHFSFFRDVELAIRLTQRNIQEEFPRLIAYNLLAGTLRSLSSVVPPTILAALARLGRIEEALQFADLMVDRRRSAEALSLIALILWKQGQEDRGKDVSEKAIKVAMQLNDRWSKVKTLSIIGKNLLHFNPDVGVSVLNQALDLTENLDESYKIDAIYEVVETIGHSVNIASEYLLSLLERSLEIIDEWRDTSYGNSALGVLAGAFRILDPARSDELFRLAINDLNKLGAKGETRKEFMIAQELARSGAHDWAAEVVRDLVPKDEKAWAYRQIALQAAIAGKIDNVNQFLEKVGDKTVHSEVNQWLAYHRTFSGHSETALEIANETTGWERGLILLSIVEAMLKKGNNPPTELVEETFEVLEAGPKVPAHYGFKQREYSLEQWGKVITKLTMIGPNKAQEIIDRLLIEAEVVEVHRADYKVWSELAKCLGRKGEFTLALECAQKLQLDWLPNTLSEIGIEMIRHGMSVQAKELSEQIEIPEYKERVIQALQKQSQSAVAEELITDSKSISSQSSEISTESMVQKARQLREQAETVQSWQSDKLKKEAVVLMAQAGYFEQAHLIVEEIERDYIRTRALVAIAAEQFKETGELPDVKFHDMEDAAVLAKAFAERNVTQAKSFLGQLLEFNLRLREQEEIEDTYLSVYETVSDFLALAEGFAHIGAEEYAEIVFAYAYKFILEDDFDPETLMREQMLPRLKELEPQLLFRIMQWCLEIARQYGRSSVLQCIGDFIPLVCYSLDVSVIRETILLIEALEVWWEHEDRFANSNT